VTPTEIADAVARLAAFENVVQLPLSIEYGERYGRKTVDHIHDAASKAYIDAVHSDGDIPDYAEPLVTTDGGHYGPPAPVAEFWIRAPEDLRLALDALAADTNADVSADRARLAEILAS
jgi:hypothetical protein